MPKVTLDMNTFRALASDTRLDILRTLDGKKMSLTDICKATRLNKATLHEHLTKLNGAGLIKKNEREGHKWVYYKLTWKGEGLLHPENTRIVVMFSITFISLLLAVMLMVNFLQPITVGIAETVDDTTYLYEAEDKGIPLMGRSYSFNYLGEIDAKEKTVGNITTELQGRAPPENIMGDNYADKDIVWFEADSVYATCDDASFSKSGYGSIETFKLRLDSEPIENYQFVLNPVVDMPSFIAMNISTNKTKESNTTEDNETNESSLGYDWDGRFLDFSPAVPKMIATVQDPTLLYFAVACLTFFGASFTLSTWRLRINKTQKI